MMMTNEPTPEPKPLYRELATLIEARRTCKTRGNTEWFQRHTQNIEALVSHHMPSGSGFDSGTKIVLDKIVGNHFQWSTGDRLVFHADFHHMDEHGYYDGWRSYSVTVTASLAYGFAVKIEEIDPPDDRERDDGWFDYAHDLFNEALKTDVSEAAAIRRHTDFTIGSQS